MFDAQAWYLPLAAAYVRGEIPDARELTDEEACALGAARGLRLYRFKRNAELPRVRAVLGTLKGLAPATLLDVGSGRGTFLWPLLDELPWTAVTSIEADPERYRQLAAAAAGGAPFRAVHADARAMPFEDRGFDVVTALEVLEHMLDSERAAAECLRVARHFVVTSVPSRPDDNPEHVRLFTPASLQDMFLSAGARSARVTHVPGHMICVAAAA